MTYEECKEDWNNQSKEEKLRRLAIVRENNNNFDLIVRDFNESEITTINGDIHKIICITQDGTLYTSNPQRLIDAYHNYLRETK